MPGLTFAHVNARPPICMAPFAFRLSFACAHSSSSSITDLDTCGGKRSAAPTTHAASACRKFQVPGSPLRSAQCEISFLSQQTVLRFKGRLKHLWRPFSRGTRRAQAGPSNRPQRSRRVWGSFEVPVVLHTFRGGYGFSNGGVFSHGFP